MRFLFLHILLTVAFVSVYPLSIAGASRDLGPEPTSYPFERDTTLHLDCYFTYPNNSSAIYSDLGNNPSELNRLDLFIRQALQIDSYSIRRIRLTGYCSIDGDSHHNMILSRERVEGFHNYLRRVYPSLYRYPVDLAWVGEDWLYLSRLLTHSRLGERSEALAIIRRHTDLSDRKRLLRQLNGGLFYNQMKEQLFPLLRRVEITVEYAYDPSVRSNYRSSVPASASIYDSIPDPLIYNVLNKRYGVLVPDSAKVWESAQVLGITRASSDSTVVTFTSPSLREELGLVSVNRGGFPSLRSVSCFDPRFAIKTNLLYWAGITPDAERTTHIYNLSLEYFLTSRWSIEAGFRYSNQSYNGGLDFQGFSGYHIEPRYYHTFSPSNPLSLYWGIYGRFGDYNQLTVDKGQSTVNTAQSTVNSQLSTLNSTGKYWDAGLSCGLHLRLFRGLGLEAGFRSGYVHSRSTVYNLHDGHRCFDHYEPYRKLRVTDLMFNLVYRFYK